VEAKLNEERVAELPGWQHPGLTKAYLKRIRSDRKSGTKEG